MSYFLNIGNIKLAMTAEESAKLNELKFQIEDYSNKGFWNKVWGTLGGAGLGTGLGLSVGKLQNKYAAHVNTNRLANALDNSPVYEDYTTLGRSNRGNLFTANPYDKSGTQLHINMKPFNTMSQVSPALTALLGGIAGSITGYELSANSESTRFAEEKVLNASSELVNLVSSILVRNGKEIGDPNVFAQKLVDQGIQLDAQSLKSLISGSNLGPLSIEQSNMDYSTMISLRNKTAAESGIEIKSPVQPIVTNTSDTPPASSEEQSAWGDWLNEHPNIKQYITNVKNMDPLTISATVAGTLLVGWGLYKAAKAWKDYRAKKLQENNSEEDNIE